MYRQVLYSRVKGVLHRESCGRQPDSNTWVLNDKVQLNVLGEKIRSDEAEYIIIWLGGMIGSRNFLMLPQLAMQQRYFKSNPPHVKLAIHFEAIQDVRDMSTAAKTALTLVGTPSSSSGNLQPPRRAIKEHRLPPSSNLLVLASMLNTAVGEDCDLTQFSHIIMYVCMYIFSIYIEWKQLEGVLSSI